jgi:hypothetical protein
MDSNILFLGLSLPGSGRQSENNPWQGVNRTLLMEDNVNWTETKFDEYEPTAVVIFGHSLGSINEVYFDELDRIAGRYPDTPILFVEDSPVFVGTETNFRSRSNLVRIAQDDSVTPVQIFVNTAAANIGDMFTYDRGCYCSTDHRPTKLVTWPASNQRCYDKCAPYHDLCAGLDTCSPVGYSC